MDSKISDLELFNYFINGSHDAFNELYERYWHVLYKIAYRILSDHEISRDIVQDVFVSFYQLAPHKNISNLRAYLLQATKYQCFMQLRAGKIAERHLQRLHSISDSNDAEERLAVAELQKIIDDEIAALPDRCREVFHLSRIEYLSNKKIAEQLHISPKTVEHQISKALKNIRLSIDKLSVLIIFLGF
jgi:RNA polymerase sigma-70 factor (family 1)